MTNKVLEIDGPPSGYFEYPTTTGVVRVTYHAINLASWDLPKLVHHVEDILTTVRDYLCEQQKPIIYWRRRPQFQQDTSPVSVRDLDFYEEPNPNYQKFYVYMRLATHPELPKEFIEKFFVEQGALAKTLD